MTKQPPESLTVSLDIKLLEEGMTSVLALDCPLTARPKGWACRQGGGREDPPGAQ